MKLSTRGVMMASSPSWPLLCFTTATFLLASSVDSFQTNQFASLPTRVNMKIDFSERLACRSIDTSRVRDGRTSSTSSSSPVLQSTQLQMTDNNASIEVGGGVIIPAGEAALQAEVAEATNTAFETADMTTVVAPSDEARQLLALEMNEVGPDGIPESPMMTYQKYLTMQEKRVKVTIRYSANAGLRPFYLTVANQIKSTHPDVLLEKRILPPTGSDAGGDDAVFEVVVDGKTIIGKKKTKLLKVRSSSSSRSSGDGHGAKGDDKNEGNSGMKGGGKGGFGEMDPPDIAGGRSIFVSMEKLDHELSKARKKRRPNTAYERKSDVLRGVAGGAIGENGVPVLVGSVEGETPNTVLETPGMTDAVMRLERLKAYSSNSRKR